MKQDIGGDDLSYMQTVHSPLFFHEMVELSTVMLSSTNCHPDARETGEGTKCLWVRVVETKTRFLSGPVGIYAKHDIGKVS